MVSDRVNVTRDYVRDLDNLLYIWKKHGRAAAFAKFAGRYVPKQNLNPSDYNMERVIAGRLAYLRMVKGEESPVWRRLQKRFNSLSERKEKYVGTDIQYLNYYTIDHFTQATGLEVHFEIEHDEELGFDMPVAFFTKGERRIYIVMSKYIRTRIKNILLSEDKTAFEKFTSRHIISYCHSGSGYFWMILRSMPKKKANDESEPGLSGQEVDFDPAMLFDFGDDFQLADGDGYPQEVKGLINDLSLTDVSAEESTNDILKKLVASNFDLNILDQWDKIKNN